VVKVAQSVAEARQAVAAARQRELSIGLVPTMGALHAGHLALIRACRAEAGFAVVSIFVNPTQFGPSEDFAKYPRTWDDDLRKCADSAVDLVFAPTETTIYPNGARSTSVEVPGLSDVLEGAMRPGHFRGVSTVVLKLFEIVRPDFAVFGQKDFQQQLVVRRMVDDLHIPVVVRTCPTVREPDGLALSSRNRFLDRASRQAATVLYRALERSQRATSDGERRADRIRQILVETVGLEPSVKLDYAEVASARTLEPLGEMPEGCSAVALLAARVGATRLIDNMMLTE
jgi:pantoate--beta-alanine ligase